MPCGGPFTSGTRDIHAGFKAGAIQTTEGPAVEAGGVESRRRSVTKDPTRFSVKRFRIPPIEILGVGDRRGSDIDGPWIIDFLSSRAIINGCEILGR